MTTRTQFNKARNNARERRRFFVRTPVDKHDSCHLMWQGQVAIYTGIVCVNKAMFERGIAMYKDGTKLLLEAIRSNPGNHQVAHTTTPPPRQPGRKPQPVVHAMFTKTHDEVIEYYKNYLSQKIILYDIYMRRQHKHYWMNAKKKLKVKENVYIQDKQKEGKNKT